MHISSTFRSAYKSLQKTRVESARLQLNAIHDVRPTLRPPLRRPLGIGACHFLQPHLAADHTVQHWCCWGMALNVFYTFFDPKLDRLTLFDSRLKCKKKKQKCDKKRT